MSTLVEASTIHAGKMFEMPNGSVYTALAAEGSEVAQQARLWCAHPPDAFTFDPPRIDLPIGQQVRLLSGDEIDTHYGHEGYVEKVFRSEMDRRHQAMMQTVYEQQTRDADQVRRDQRAGRPWWKKLFG